MNYPISPINAISLSLLKTEPKPPSTNEEELKKLETLIETQKSKGHKYPLLACVFSIFHSSGKNTLTKAELYNLMEKKATEDKNKIISSPTERYCIITPNNFKAKIKDIIKKKKWFTRAIDDKGDIIYTLNPGVVWQITPKIESYLKVIEKRDSIFQNKAREEIENMQKSQEKSPKKRKRKRGDNKIKKFVTKSELKENDLINIANNDKKDIKENSKENNNTQVNEIAKDLNEIKMTNENEKKEEINTLNKENNNLQSLNNISSINTLNSINSLNNDNINIEAKKNENNENNNQKENLIQYTNTLINPILIDSSRKTEENKENNSEINNDINTEINKEDDTIIKLNDNTNKNISQNIINKTENEKKVSKSLSNIIEIKDNDDDFDIIIEDGREKSLNNNHSNSEQISNNVNKKNEDDINKEIEAILNSTKSYPINNNINNQKIENKKENKIQNKKKTKKNKLEEINLDNISEDVPISAEEDHVIDLTNQRRNPLNYKTKNKKANTDIKLNKSLNKSLNKNNIVNIKHSKSKNKTKTFLNNKRKLKKILPKKGDKTKSKKNISNKNKKKFLKDNNSEEEYNIDLNEEKKTIKKKDPKKSNILGGKMNSIISIGEILLNLTNKDELSQLMNKKIVYFKQKIEKKEKEIAEDKKLIENLIHSGEKIKLVKNKEILELINNLKNLYKIFKDKIVMLHGYKEAIEKLEKNDKKNIVEGISNYKQVYIESNQILNKIVNLINLIVNEYGNLDEFINIICFEEKETWVKQNIGINNYDFRKKIKSARSIDDITDLFKQELDKVKIDVDLFKKYDKTNKNQNKDKTIFIELNKSNEEKGNEDNNYIQIEEENDDIIIENNKKEKNINDITNKENIDENNLENNKKVNMPESLDTNFQSVELTNN